MLEIDGSFGEGGGQILRTALSLSMCTGKPFRISNIRAKRKKAGLLRQHLTAVMASADICAAEVTGAELGSQELVFVPGKIRGGDYRFAIGSAGSCTLVLQTLLPALWSADAPSRVVLQGGTHNPLAPPFHFLERAFMPVIERMGIAVSLQLDRFGFHPAGGGQISVTVTPAAVLAHVHLQERGTRKNGFSESFIAGIPAHVAKRELAGIAEGLNWADEQLRIRQVHHDEGPGNALLVTLEHPEVTEVFSGFGEKGVSAEVIARKLVREVRDYLSSDAVVSEHLADQLLLPMAMAGGGSFTASRLTQHTTSNMEVIQRFLPVTFVLEQRQHSWKIAVEKA